MHEAHDALTCIGSKLILMKKIELNIAINIIFKSNEEMFQCIFRSS